MIARRTVTLTCALAALALIRSAPALAYDDSWYKTDFWSGEYPNGFTLEKDLTTNIRATADPKAAQDIECPMKKGETYHPWNQSRVAASKLEFVTYVPTATYVITKPGKFFLHNEKTEKDMTIALKKGEEWTYLTYYAEGMFKMSYKGTHYAAEQELIEASKEKGAKAPDRPQLDDEWMKLTCANGNSGWLLSRDVLGKPGFATPHYPEYGVARDQ